MPKYFRIPQCPRCQSWHTGRYIKSFTKLSDREIAQYLKKGEKVRPSLEYYSDRFTHMYCEDCNAQWEGYINPVELSYDEIKKEKEKRGIGVLDSSNIKLYKKNKRINNNINKVKNAFNNIKNFMKN